MLLEETMGLWLRNGNSQEFRRHVDFIFRITDVPLFDDNFSIFHKELKLFPNIGKYWFMDKHQEARIRNHVSLITQGKMPRRKDIQPALDGIAKNREKVRNMRSLGIRMRADISGKLKALGAKYSQITETWDMLRDKNLEKFGSDLLKKNRFHTPLFRWLALKRWLKHAPYFRDWACGILYMQNYAMRYPNLKIDEHAQSDIQQLLYLRQVDAIVSEEEAFMKQAWEDLYKSQGKLYLKIAQLSSF